MLVNKTYLSNVLVGLLIGVIISCSSEKKQDADTGEADAAPEYVGEEIFYSTDSITMKGYMAYDKNESEKRPGILVVHEWWGHNAYSRERADMLAKLGYVAMAVDMYGDGKQAGHPQDAGKFAMQVMSNMDEAKNRFNKAIETLKSNPKVDADKIAAIGYCFGGSVVLAMANSGIDLDAVAAFHSGVELPVMPTNDIKAKVLVCNGADDSFISPESITAYKSAMDSVSADYKYIAYEGAVHSFTSKYADSLGKKFDLPLAYQEKADKASWEELQTLLTSAFN